MWFGKNRYDKNYAFYMSRTVRDCAEGSARGFCRKCASWFRRMQELKSAPLQSVSRIGGNFVARDVVEVQGSSQRGLAEVWYQV